MISVVTTCQLTKIILHSIVKCKMGNKNVLSIKLETFSKMLRQLIQGYGLSQGILLFFN